MNNETAVTPRFIQKKNISEDLVVYIKQQILNGDLNPGDRIVETKLARELGISQTPVREALRQLQGEGVVSILPNKGPIVRTLDIQDAYEIYSIRSMLEGLAIRLATQISTDQEIMELEQFYNQMKTKLTDDSVAYLLHDSSHIHETIIKMSRHSRLISMYKSISFQISLINRLVGAKSTKQKEIDEHQELIEALKRKDPDHAEETMRRHIYNSYCNFIKLNGLEAEAPNFTEKAWL